MVVCWYNQKELFYKCWLARKNVMVQVKNRHTKTTFVIHTSASYWKDIFIEEEGQGFSILNFTGVSVTVNESSRLQYLQICYAINKCNWFGEVVWMEKENNLRPINLKEEINVVILCRALPVNEWMQLPSKLCWYVSLRIYIKFFRQMHNLIGPNRSDKCGKLLDFKIFFKPLFTMKFL